MNFTAAIFDLDGTLADSNGVWKKIDIAILQKRGIRCSDAFAESLAAMTYEEAAAEMHRLGVKDTTEELIRECNELAAYEYRHNIFLKPYAAEYLTYLKNSGVKTALATASPKMLYEPVLRHNNVYGLFDAFCTTEEAGRSKDYPDVYLHAASKLGYLPMNALFLRMCSRA